MCWSTRIPALTAISNANPSQPMRFPARASSAVGAKLREEELAHEKVLVARHRPVRVTAGQGVREDDLLVGRERFASGFEIEHDRFRLARRIQDRKSVV